MTALPSDDRAELVRVVVRRWVDESCEAQESAWQLLAHADEAEAVLIDTARGQEVQLVDHVIVTTDESSVDPRRLQDRQFEGSLEELPTGAVVNENEVAIREAHRK